MKLKLKFKILLLAAVAASFGVVWTLFIMTQIGFGVASANFALRGPANQVRTVYSYACNDGTMRRVGNTEIANALSALGCIGRGGVKGVQTYKGTDESLLGLKPFTNGVGMIEGCGGDCAKAIIGKWRQIGSPAPAHTLTFFSDGRTKIEEKGKILTQGYRFVDGTRYRVWGRGIPLSPRVYMQVGVKGDQMTLTFDGRQVHRYKRVR